MRQEEHSKPLAGRPDQAPCDEVENDQPLGFGELLQTVLGALIGVQSEAARQRDFSKGRPLHFVIIGIVATVVCVLVLVSIVRLALAGI